MNLSLFEKQSGELREALSSNNLKQFHEQIVLVVQQFKEAFAAGKKVYVAGNGGSAAEAQHLAEELVGRYKTNRPAYPAIALTSDGTALTCISNDFGFENIFKRQLEAFGQAGDIFVALSTSGNSRNILLACDEAHARGMTIIALTGPAGKLKEVADYVISAPTKIGARMQELHLHAIHLICEAFELHES